MTHSLPIPVRWFAIFSLVLCGVASAAPGAGDSAVPPEPAENAAAPAASAISTPASSGDVAESMATRQLRDVLERERVVWERLHAHPDDAAEKQRAETDFRDIITAYENVIRASPDFGEAYAAYGYLLSRTGNREEAVKAFVRANQLNPNLSLVKNQLGNYFTEEGNYVEALGYYLSAVALAPEQPLYHYQLGTLLYEFRDYFIKDGLYDRATLDAKMQAAFRRAAELAPDAWGFIYRYAESFYDLDQPDWPAALAEWDKLEQRAKPGVERSTIRLHRANILLHIGRVGEARALLDSVTEPVLATQKQSLVDQLAAAAATN